MFRFVSMESGVGSVRTASTLMKLKLSVDSWDLMPLVRMNE